MVGARVCSFLLVVFTSIPAAAAGATILLRPTDTGTVTYAPSVGVLDDTDRRVISACEAPSPGLVAFSRGYFEFDLRDPGFEVASATLTLRETFEVGEYQLPVALHELSWYPADLAVNGDDLDVPTTAITSFVTDDGDPGQFFDIDVTALVRAMSGASLGFRLKLAVDPDSPCDPEGTLGAAFDGLMEAAPPLLTLTEAEPLAVPLDIAPSECPSPLDVHDNKLLVAINGHDDLDVRLIDPGSVRLKGIAPLRTQIRDLSAPYFPLRGKEGPFACLSDGRDGVPDLLLVFDTRAVVRAIESSIFNPLGLLDGQVLHLGVDGRLKAEAGGERFSGEDVVIVRMQR